MDFDYVVIPALILVVGVLVMWFCIRRMVSLSTKSYRTWRKVAERIVLSTVVLLVTGVAGICTFNAIKIQVFRAANPPLGMLYTVNGKKMQLYCTGTGSPTIVLEPGGGVATDVVSWGGLQPELAKISRVCSYDRAGLGWSEPQPGPRDADHIATELHKLLAQAKVNGPLVLMGHSLGGMYIRDYAAHYPSDVAGLILMDSSTPLQERRFEAVTGPSKAPSMATQLTIFRALYILGIPRLLGWCGRPIPGMESKAGKALAEDACQPHHAAANELLNVERSGEETVHTGPFAAIPILIISSDPAMAQDPKLPQRTRAILIAHNQMQEDLKDLSTRSRRIIAKGSGHEVHGDRKDLVLKETRLFIEQIRGKAPQATNYGSTTIE